MQVYKCAVWDWVQFSSLESYLEWINVSAFSASVNHESVKASISARNCNQASLLAGPSRPETQGNIVWVGPVLQIPLKISKFTLTKCCGMCAYGTHRWTCTDKETPTKWGAFAKLISTERSTRRSVAWLRAVYLRRYFCRWCRFLLLVGSGRPVFSSSPRLPARLWPDKGWHWSQLRGNRQRQSCTYWGEDKERRCQHRLDQNICH